MLANMFFELRFQTMQSIEKLVAASKNPELTNHTQRRNQGEVRHLQNFFLKKYNN